MSKNTINPFWSWNDKLRKEELIKQIELMKKSGIEGFFMHARGGLKTEYMGDDWFDCIKACMDKANELGMGHGRMTKTVGRVVLQMVSFRKRAWIFSRKSLKRQRLIRAIGCPKICSVFTG